jgi:hypothetical protein
MVARFARTPGFLVATLDQPLLVGADGRQDFPHFWLYSLLVAPIVAVADTIGVHPNHAFTIFNGALILLLSWWFIREQRPMAAALLVAGPLIWWIDKAHAEVFLFVTIAGALMTIERLPRIAGSARGAGRGAELRRSRRARRSRCVRVDDSPAHRGRRSPHSRSLR